MTGNDYATGLVHPAFSVDFPRVLAKVHDHFRLAVLRLIKANLNDSVTLEFHRLCLHQRRGPSAARIWVLGLSFNLQPKGTRLRLQWRRKGRVADENHAAKTPPKRVPLDG